MQVKKKPKKTAKAVPEKSRKKKQPSEDQIKKQPFFEADALWRRKAGSQ